jgi:hypothetical protein
MFQMVNEHTEHRARGFNMANQSVSSLIRAAESARSKQLTLEDNLAAYKWNNSEQTRDDYLEYKTYLEKRQGVTSDPSQQLTYQNKIDSARTAFSSNEIQRVAIGVLEGSASLQDKQSTVIGLYREAVGNGDLNLAQNLRNTYDSIDTQIQRQAEADATKMATYADKMAKAQVTDLADLAQSYLTGDNPNNPTKSIKQLEGALKQYGSDFFNDVATTKDGTQFNVWDAVHSNVTQAIQAFTQAANIAYAAGNDSRGDSMYEKALKMSNGDTPIKFAGVSVTLQDINDARDAARNGQNLFQVRKDANGENTLIKNKVTDYVWARDTTGALRIVQTMNEQGQSFNTALKGSDGKPLKDANGKAITVESKLKAAGYEVMGTDSSGLLRIRDTNSTGRANADPNSSLGESYLVSLDDNGNVRYVSEKGDGTGQKIFQINLADPNAPDFGAAQEVDASAETFFGNSSINSATSHEGVNYINKLLAPLQGGNNGPIIPDNAQIKLFNGDFSQFYSGDPVSGVIHGAQIQRADLSQRFAAASTQVQQQAQQNLQTTVTPQNTPMGGANINQMPVPAGAKLTVAAPQPQPKIVVAPPQPQPKINIAKPAPQPTLKVGSGSGTLQGGVGNPQGSSINLKVL